MAPTLQKEGRNDPTASKPTPRRSRGPPSRQKIPDSAAQ